MEKQEAYVTDTQTNTTALTCPDCHFVIGPIVTRNGHIVVLVGGMPLYALHGYCARCNGKVNWTGNDERLRRLVRRVKSD